MRCFTTLAISDPAKLLFGTAPHPVRTRRGLTIGGGTVYPELNFTLPPMAIDDRRWPEIRTIYRDIIEDACRRACELSSNGFVVEFETLIEMTETPRRAVELTTVINDLLESFYAKRGLKTALRITPNDTRELDRPPRMREGRHLENMLAAFDGCARAGAEFLSIESTGGKEIHDEALMMCDIRGVMFALAIMGCRDMEFLWRKIVEIAAATGTRAAGDTACGFGNTAMVMAEKHLIPKVFAAVVRAITVPRSLVAYEQGAVGPGKDCGYENPMLKAITGCPMAMEGKAAACAHASPLGNIAAATADLWSNESVQQVKLLGGMAPTVSMEQLEYDCRLFNRAIAAGQSRMLRDLLTDSDRRLDPQATILDPRNVVRIAAAVVKESGHYARSRAAAREAVAILREESAAGSVHIPERETEWLPRLEAEVESLPESEEAFIGETIDLIDASKWRGEDYGF